MAKKILEELLFSWTFILFVRLNQSSKGCREQRKVAKNEKGDYLMH